MRRTVVAAVASAPFTYSHVTGGGAYDDRTIGKNLDVTIMRKVFERKEPVADAGREISPPSSSSPKPNIRTTPS